MREEKWGSKDHGRVIEHQNGEVMGEREALPMESVGACEVCRSGEGTTQITYENATRKSLYAN